MNPAGGRGTSSNPFLEKNSSRPGWHRYLNALIAAEISDLTRYYDQVIQYRPLPHDSGFLLSLVQCARKSSVDGCRAFPDLSGEHACRSAVLLNGTLNHDTDIQECLSEVKPKLARTARLIVVAYNPYWSWLYRLASVVGLRQGEPPTTFLTHTDFINLARLSGYELVRTRPVAYVPLKLLGLGTVLNRILPAMPFIRKFGFASLMILRPIIAPHVRPRLTVLIPARNERGNIEEALKRMPDFGTDLEIIYVEGHSTDGTWDEIQRVARVYGDRFKIKIFQQEGKGKADAVHLGLTKAGGDVLVILDADLTMPPELLGRFYEAYCGGLADFVNGTRLVYPMEGEAMRFLNRLGNIFFAKALSWVLDARLGDSLCGTKLFARHDYDRMTAWRKDFDSEFDPFGDFEILFPAAVMALGIVDVPIRYRARTYGTTNISRFRHGWMLFKMTLIGFFRIRLGKPV